MTPEELFIALDGRSVHAARERLRIEVFAVRDEAGLRWVQLALKGTETVRHLMLRLKTGDTAQHAVLILSSWLANPAEVSDVINVA